MTLSGSGLGTVTPVTGSGTYAVLRITDTIFRFFYTGAFVPGQVTATFAAGGWADSAGNAGPAGSGSFTVIAPAKSFFIELSGGIILNAAGFTSEPLMQLSADVKLEIDPVNKIFKLTFSGQLSIYKLGTVGATAGFFELDLSNQTASGPQFWGVATLATNFSALQPYGIFLYGSGTLQINLTEQVHTETLTLPGLGPNGSNATQTFTLQPLSFLVQIAGAASITPPGTSTPLVSLTGGFLLSLNPGGMTIYATASLSYGAGPSSFTYGEGTGLLIIQTGLTPGRNPGIAGYLTVGSGADLGLPGVGSLFSISGSVSVMFNTTLQDQVFQIPDAFLPLLKPGDPTSITIYASAPGLTGGRNPLAPPGGEVYVSAQINAQITIGGVLTLNGFIQIQAGATTSGTLSLSITGAVSTQISFLGALSGELNLTAFVNPVHPDQSGVVGRVFLALNVDRIPGVTIGGEFLLELNTFAAQQTIQTFAIATDSQGRFNGFARDSAGNLIATNTTITTTQGFHLLLRGSIVVANLVTIAAYAELTIDTSEVRLTVSGTMALGPLGTLNVSGDFHLSSAGLAAYVGVDVSALGGSIGIGFSASAFVGLNTTGQQQQLLYVDPVTSAEHERARRSRLPAEDQRPHRLPRLRPGRRLGDDLDRPQRLPDRLPDLASCSAR